jgi:hypothetical protein
MDSSPTPSPAAEAGPSQASYKLTPEQLAAAERETEEYRKIWAHMGGPEKIPLREDPERQRQLLHWAVGGFVALIVVGLVAAHSGSPSSVIGGAVALALAAVLFIHLDFDTRSRGALASGLVLMGVWAIVSGLMIPPLHTDAAGRGLPIEEIEALAHPRQGLSSQEPMPSPPLPALTGPAPATAPSPGTPAGNVGGLDCRVTVQNHCPTTQHIFLDGAYLGSVPANSVGSWNVFSGRHVIVSADSVNIRDNPASESFAVSQNQVYTLTVSQH